MHKALTDPGSVFAMPKEVVAHPALSREEKIEILRRWECDERNTEVAEGENMAGGPEDGLSSVLEALHALGA